MYPRKRVQQTSYIFDHFDPIGTGISVDTVYKILLIVIILLQLVLCNRGMRTECFHKTFYCRCERKGRRRLPLPAPPSPGFSRFCRCITARIPPATTTAVIGTFVFGQKKKKTHRRQSFTFTLRRRAQCCFRLVHRESPP